MHTCSNFATSQAALVINTILHLLFEDDDDQLLVPSTTSLPEALLLLHGQRRVFKPRIRFYTDDVVSAYNFDDFRSVFRMSRGTAEQLAIIVGGIIKKSIQTSGRSPIPIQKQLLIAVYYMANQGSIRRIADKFGVADSSVIQARRNIVNALNTIIKSVIKWPTGSEVNRVQNAFEKKRGMSGVIGAIDGTHVHILAPTHKPEVYVNRKGFHSINVQAVCDDQMFFTDVYAGWPGSVHDARMYSNSPLGQQLRDNPKQLCPGDSYIVGDAAYPLSQYLLTPFRDTGHLSNDQKNYNFVHSSTRMVIERAFGLLKGRFRRLKMLEVLDDKERVDVLSAIFVVHNVCLISEKDEDLESFIDDTEEHNITDVYENTCRSNMSVRHAENTGVQKRQVITESLGCHV